MGVGVCVGVCVCVCVCVGVCEWGVGWCGWSAWENAGEREYYVMDVCVS